MAGLDFLSKIYEMVKSRLSDAEKDEFKSLQHSAAGHAGGKARGRNQADPETAGQPDVGDVHTPSSTDAILEMAYSSNADLPDAVHSALPSEAQGIFRDAFNKAFAKDATNEAMAFQAGWRAVRNAGFIKGNGDKWHKATGIDEEDYTRSFVEQPPYQLAEVPTEIQILPGAGQSFTHPTYGDITITEAKLTEFEANFASHIYQDKVPIDLEHQGDLSGAVGYIESLDNRGKEGLFAKVDWNERGREAIEGDRFKYFSPEWYDEWHDPITGKTYSNVLTGGALCTKPFFKDKAMTRVATEHPDDDNVWDKVNKAAKNGCWAWTGALNDRGYPYVWKSGKAVGAHRVVYELEKGTLKAEQQIDHTCRNKLCVNPAHLEAVSNAENNRRKVRKETTMSEKELILTEEQKAQLEGGDSLTLTADQLEALGQDTKETVDAREETKRTLTEQTTKITAQESQIRDLRERMATSDKARIAKRYTDLVAGRAEESDGAAWSGDPEANVAHLLALAEKFGEDGDEVKFHVKGQVDHAKQLQDMLANQEIGSSGIPTTATRKAAGELDPEVESLARKMVDEDKSLTIEDARIRVFDENPRLYTKLQAQHPGNRTSTSMGGNDEADDE